MNFKALIKAKLDEQEILLTTASAEGRGLSDEEQTKYDALDKEIERLEASQAAADKHAKKIEDDKTPVNEPLYAQPKKNEGGVKVFNNFGEQLKAVKRAASGNVDERLMQLNKEYNAASGMNENNGGDGGFAVQTDFAGILLDSAAKSGDILPNVSKYEIGPGKNSVEWVTLDETDLSASVCGGVFVAWAAEAETIAASKPKLKKNKMELEKLLGFAYSTYELDDDSAFISQLYLDSFTIAIQRALEAAIISGDGIGKPIGLLNAGSKVTVPKETNQDASTILWENITHMYNRALNKDAISYYTFLMHPDAADQVDFLTFPVGTAGEPIYLPISQAGNVTQLKGKPIIESDHCSALGTEGDIIFANLKDYMLITKGGVRTDTSIHVLWSTAENAFRIIFRANGMPMRNKSLKLKNSSLDRSTIITLGTRA